LKVTQRPTLKKIVFYCGKCVAKPTAETYQQTWTKFSTYVLKSSLSLPPYIKCSKVKGQGVYVCVFLNYVFYVFSPKLINGFLSTLWTLTSSSKYSVISVLTPKKYLTCSKVKGQAMYVYVCIICIDGVFSMTEEWILLKVRNKALPLKSIQLKTFIFGKVKVQGHRVTSK
jgi:hypothetical protein